MILDRVLYSSMYYPANYGFIPRTYCDDKDPLDIMIVSQVEIVPLCIVPAKVIGVMRMLDNGEADDKIIAVNAGDPSINYVNDITELADHTTELRNFFEEYTKLENKTVEVEEFLIKIFHQIIQEAFEMYGVFCIKADRQYGCKGVIRISHGYSFLYMPIQKYQVYLSIPLHSLEHFNIDTLQSKTVAEICQQYQISEALFIAIGNLYLRHEVADSTAITVDDLPTIIHFLNNTHRYYLDDIYPKIERAIQEIQQLNDSKEIALLERFFELYFNEVREHLNYELEVVHPYIVQLIKQHPIPK